jgi:uncharacterized protein (TIGR02453 family)
MVFRGWPIEALEFYEGLAADNSKTYWLAHKTTYDEVVYAPMAELLVELEPEFGPAKIFRPYRDVRFSADKSPYKTAIAASFTDGGYIHLSAEGLASGNGIYVMSPDQLKRYRAAVLDEPAGQELEHIRAAAAAAKIDITAHDQLKTIPRGFPKEHPRAELLRNKGLIAWKQWPVAAWLGRPTARTKVEEFLRATSDLNTWLATHVGRE